MDWNLKEDASDMKSSQIIIASSLATNQVETSINPSAGSPTGTLLRLLPGSNRNDQRCSQNLMGNP